MPRAAIFALLFLGATPVYAQSDLVFAQMAVGGTPAYETVVQIVNEVEAGNPILIEVFQGRLAGASNGLPLPVRFDGGPLASSLNVTLSPFQEFSTTLTGSGTSLMNGWIRVRSTLAGGKISGSVIFRQRIGNSIVDTVGATSPQRYREAIVQVDQREPGSDTGVAFANPDGTPVVVTLDLFQGLARAVFPAQITLQPGQHFARLVSEIFPAFGAQQGTLVIEVSAGRAVPCVALRVDSIHLTSVPVRPLGFSFSYSVTSDSGTTVETGVWLFDLTGFNLIGTGKIETPAAADLPEVTGGWTGTNFQFRYRKVLADNTVGMVVFNGTSAGPESTVGSDGKGKVISGKVTTLGADGRVVSVNNFTAYHRFGAPPQ